MQTELFMYDYDVRYTGNYNRYLITHTATEHMKCCFFKSIFSELESVFPIHHNLPYEVASCGLKNPYERFMY